MSEINRKMFSEIHSIVTEFPMLHRQRSWQTVTEDSPTCGTTRCVAGWAVWLAAREAGLLERKRDAVTRDTLTTLAARLDLTEGELDHLDYYGEYQVHEYPVLGGQLLGLSGDQAQSLFHDYNHMRVVARLKSYAETGEDISEEEYDRYDAEELKRIEAENEAWAEHEFRESQAASSDA